MTSNRRPASTGAVVTLDAVREEALTLLEEVREGPALDETTSALIAFAVRISVPTLDPESTQDWVARALDAGATAEQVHEAIVLVSALGVHSLMEGSRRLARVLRERGDTALDAPLDADRAALRLRLQGDDRFWVDFEREVPGFLDALLRVSPEAYEAFFAYCAVPWRSGHLPALTKELISLASDATPAHRYLPGLRLHLANAVRLGAGRLAVLQALEIAAAAPQHRGVPAQGR